MRLAQHSLLLAVALGMGVSGWSGLTSSALAAGDSPTPNWQVPGDVEGAWIDDTPAPEAQWAAAQTFGSGTVAPAPTPAPQAQPLQPAPSGNYAYDGEQQYDSYAGAGDGGGCEDGSCDGGDGYGGHGHFHGWPAGSLWNQVHSHRRFYAKAEYLTMWAKGGRIPALVTTSPVGTAQNEAGVLGFNTTSILFGNDRIDDQRREGGRINVGMWLVDGEFLGIEGHYMAFRQITGGFSAAGNFSDQNLGNDLILARPFFDTNTLAQNSVLVAYPNAVIPGVQNPSNLNGFVNVGLASEVQSAGALMRRLLWIDFTDNYRVDVLGGYRWFRLNDSLIVNDSSTFNAGLAGITTIASQDGFFADNQFNGAEFGFDAQIFRGRFSWQAIMKCALGNNREKISIDGNTTTTVAGVSFTSPGGVLAEPSNIGQTHRNLFTVIPEVTLAARCDLTTNLRATLGYNFLWVSNVVRAGSQIDTNIDSRQIHIPFPGATAPSRVLTDSSFYLHGISAGLELNF